MSINVMNWLQKCVSDLCESVAFEYYLRNSSCSLIVQSNLIIQRYPMSFVKICDYVKEQYY